LTTDDVNDTITITNNATGDNAFGNLAVAGQSTLAADSTNDTLTLVAGTGITLTTDAGSDTLTITNSSLGANSFGTIAVSGSADVVADSTSDLLTFVAGAGITITTDSVNDEISISGIGSIQPFNTELFTATAGQTTFNLVNQPQSENQLMVFIEGVYQNSNSYALTGSTVVLDSPGASVGEEVVFHIIGSGVAGTGHNLDSFSGDDVTTDFTLSVNPINERNVFVFFDGVYQNKSEFSVTGDVISFNTAPLSGDTIEVITPSITMVNQPAVGSVTASSLSSELAPVYQESASFATTSATDIASLSASTYRSVKFQIQLTDTVTNEYHITEVNCIHDGTTVYITEFGTIFTGVAALGTFDAILSGGNILLQVTPVTTNAMTSKVIHTPIAL